MIIEKFEKMNNFFMKNILFIIIVFILVYLFMGFKEPAQQQLQQYNGYELTTSPNMMLASKSVTSQDFNNDKIIKNFSLTIESFDTEKTISLVQNKIEENNAIVDNFYSYNYSSNSLAYNFSIKVPSEIANDVVNFFKTLGIVKSESTYATNTEEEYLYNQEKLKNLYIRRDRLREMMKTKTQNLSDTIAVDRELSNVQNTIDAIENTNKKIDKQVDYSKIELTIIPDIDINSFNNNNWRINKSWKSAVNSLISFTQKSIDYGFKFVTFIPVIITVSALLFAIKLFIVKFILNKN